MKKLYIIIGIIITLISTNLCYYTPDKAFAISQYGRVIDANTPFYKSVYDTSPLFYLPYTYYVKVLGQTEEYTHVEIHGDNGITGLDGYVPKEMLYYDGLEVENPYLNIYITTANTTILYNDFNLSSSCQYIFASRNLYYYGQIVTEDGNLFYVGYNNRLGYVKETDILPFSIANHPNKLTFITDSLSPEVETPPISNDTSEFFGLKAIIIVCLFFAGIVALLLALGKKSGTGKTNYYEENDYE